MIVAEQNKMDGWQVRERYTGCPDSFGSGPRNRAGAFGENRISQQAEASKLDEKARMVDKRNSCLVGLKGR